MAESIKKVKWEKAIKLIEANNLGKKCINLIQAAETSAMKLKEKAEVFYLEYEYGSPIIKESQLVLPNGGKNNGNYSCKKVIPVCLVLERQAEVFLPHEDVILSNNKVDSPRSLRLLEPGDLFGVFETANRICQRAHYREDWWVTAGSRTARFLYPLKNTNVKKYLYSEFSNIDCSSEAFQNGTNCYEDWTWYLMKGMLQKTSTNWSMKIIVFPDCWFAGEAGLKFQNEILKAAWHQSQVNNIKNIRRVIISDTIENSQNSNFGQLESIGLANIVEWLTLLDDVVNARSLVHVPSSPDKDGNCPGGPFGTIIKSVEQELLKKRRNKKEKKTHGKEAGILPMVIVPKYLMPNCNGYVSLSRPVSFTSNLKQKRMNNFLTTLGESINSLKSEFEALIPKLDWDKFYFYGQFTGSSQNCNKVSQLSNLYPKLHTSNRFFLHSMHVTRKG